MGSRQRIAMVIMLVLVTLLALNGVSALDRFGLLLLRDDTTYALMGPRWFAITVRDVTALGSNWILIFLITSVCLILIIAQRVRHAVTLAVMAIGGVILSMGAKYIFDRPRPDLVEPLIHVYTPSFPSGHATMSMVCFLGAALVLTSVDGPARVRKAVIILAVVMSMFVGISRVLLGVHWPTDIIAGWLLGALWVDMVYRRSQLFKSRVVSAH